MNNNSKVQKNIAKLTRAVIHTTDSDFALLCVICLKDYECRDKTKIKELINEYKKYI